MGEASRERRGMWIVPVLIAGAVIVLLVVLSTPPPVTLPEAPDERDGPRGPGDTPDPGLAEFHHPLSRRIEGRVLRNGQGFAAELTLLLFKRFGGHPLRHGRSDASGFFSFPGVPPGRHEVAAIGPAGVRVRRSVTVPVGIDPQFIKLRLPHGGNTLHGRAMHADGRPFSGEVELFFGGHSWSAPTRADGRFTIPGLADGRYDLTFRSGEAFRAQCRAVELPATKEELFIVDEGAQPIRGRVFDLATGEPVAGAELEIDGYTTRGGTLHRKVRSDSAGRFETTMLIMEGRVHDLIVTAPGYRPWRLSGFPLADEIEIGLEASARLTVTVVAAEGGAPVPFVPVTAWFRSLPEVNGSRKLLTDRHGRAVFSSISGDMVWLDVRGHGYIADLPTAGEESRAITLAAGEEREVEISVQRSVVLMGTVTTSGGEPVRGGWVGFKTSDLSGNRNLLEGHEFQLPDLRPGDFWLRASRQGLLGEAITGTLSPGEVRSFKLQLAAGAWLPVLVLAEDTGRPLKGATVVLSGRGRRTTDAAGRARFGPFASRDGEVRAWADGYTLFRQRVECVVGDPIALEVTLSRGLSLGGRVLLPDGTPATGAVVRLAGSGTMLYRFKATVGEDGAFLLRGLPSCRLYVSASRRDRSGRVDQCQQLVQTGTTDAVLVLERGVEIKQRSVALVVSDADGLPIPRAEFDVRMRNAAGEELDLDPGRIANGSGEFKIEPAAVDVLLYVHSARRPTSVPLPLGAAVFGPYPANSERIEVELPPERSITGKVLSPAGRGLPGLEIEGLMASLPGMEVSSRYPWSARTGPDGSFRIGGLGAGPVTLEVHVPVGMMLADPVVVPAGRQGVVIRLDSPASAEVTVRDRQGRPVADAFVEVWNQARIEGGGTWESSEGSGSTDETGRTQITDLPGTARHILIVRDYGVGDLAPVRIDGWVPRDTGVTMPPALSISGRVVDWDPRGDEELFSWSRVTGWDTVHLDSRGRFEEGSFAEGRVALVWIPAEANGHDELIHDPEQSRWPITWVRAGEEGIELRRPSR